MRVVISTFFEGHATKKAIAKLSPEKVYLLIDEPKREEVRNKIKNSFEEIKKFYQDILEVVPVKIRSYDIPYIIENVLKIIRDESKKESEIIIHISEGRKITSLALLFAAYSQREKVSKAYYVTEEEHELISLPLISFSLGGSKKKILQEIDKGNYEVRKLEQKLNIKQSSIYQHLQELKEEGYIMNQDGLKLTELGRIMIL